MSVKIQTDLMQNKRTLFFLLKKYTFLTIYHFILHWYIDIYKFPYVDRGPNFLPKLSEIVFASMSCMLKLFLSADSISSALLVGLSGEERKEGRLFSNSLEEMEELKVWRCYCRCSAVA